MNEERIKEMDKLYAEVCKERIKAEAGGGFVSVTLDGWGHMIEIAHEDNPYITGDLNMFKELIKIAYNEAFEKVKENAQKTYISRLGKIVGVKK